MRKYDGEFRGFGHLKYKPLAATEGNDCEFQFLTPRGIDYCLKSSVWLCRGLVAQGRCPK